MTKPHSDHVICRFLESEFQVPLDEITYKDLWSVVNPRDLPHRDYAPLLKFVEYEQTVENTTKFLVHNNKNGWNTYVQWEQWNDLLHDTSLNAVEAARMLIWTADVRLHCQCPSYLYHGYEYILTELGAAIYPETRFPHIRNPLLKGIACKHLRRCLAVLPFQSGKLASAIKQQRKKL